MAGSSFYANVSSAVAVGDGRHGGGRGQKERREQRQERQPEAPARDAVEFAAFRPTAGGGVQALLSVIRQSNEGIARRARQYRDWIPVTTPHVLGLPLEEATALLGQAGLRVARVGREHSGDVPEGCVFLQMPGPGVDAVRPLGVALMVSKGAGTP